MTETALKIQMAEVPLVTLKTVWFQVSGTECNLECKHCFLGCGPSVKTHAMMSRQLVKSYLDEAVLLGVKEFYLTGGEPFLNPELLEITGDALLCGDLTILTNATLISEDISSKLKNLEKASCHNLRFRVSIESPDEEENDSVRGKGSFRRSVKGVRNLIGAGFNPIITSTDFNAMRQSKEEDFRKWLTRLGAGKPELKVLPTLYLGRAEENIRSYREEERVTAGCFENYSMKNLQCSYCRMVTAEGVYVCPILIDDRRAMLGITLRNSLVSYEMSSHACYTCRTAGLCCSNEGTPAEDAVVTRDDVKEFYGRAAENPQQELCCPTLYNAVDTSHIPDEVLQISYGCGSPVSLADIKNGETILDLGSGGGIDCFIAAKLVGREGRVIGIDMTDEMLSKAQSNMNRVEKNLGYNNIEFRKGILEKIPAEDNSVDIVTSNCVVNLSPEKERVFCEIYRLLKDGGRFVISDIVSDTEVPSDMQMDTKLWGECISGALTVSRFLQYATESGFHGISILSKNHYKDVNSIRFYSVTFMGYKSIKGDECIYAGQTALYLGPFSSVSDDEGHSFPRGIPVEICTGTAIKLKKAPYDQMFIVTEPAVVSGESCGPGCC